MTATNNSGFLRARREKQRVFCRDTAVTRHLPIIVNDDALDQAMIVSYDKNGSCIYVQRVKRGCIRDTSQLKPVI